MCTGYCTPWSKAEMSPFEAINHPTIMFFSSYKFSPALYCLGEDQHGLRSRDLDHKNKQNYDAVEHIIKASSLLDIIPGKFLGNRECTLISMHII